MSYPEYYHRRANAEALLAHQSALLNIHVSHLRAAAARRELARRAELVAQMKERRAADAAVEQLERT